MPTQNKYSSQTGHIYKNCWATPLYFTEDGVNHNFLLQKNDRLIRTCTGTEAFSSANLHFAAICIKRCIWDNVNMITLDFSYGKTCGGATTVNRLR